MNEPFSKPEDQIVRRWISARFGVRVPQYGLWKMTPQEAAEYLHQFPSLAKIKAEDLVSAAKRNQKGIAQ